MEEAADRDRLLAGRIGAEGTPLGLGVLVAFVLGPGGAPLVEQVEGFPGFRLAAELVAEGRSDLGPLFVAAVRVDQEQGGADLFDRQAEGGQVLKAAVFESGGGEGLLGGIDVRDLGSVQLGAGGAGGEQPRGRVVLVLEDDRPVGWLAGDRRLADPGEVRRQAEQAGEVGDQLVAVLDVAGLDRDHDAQPRSFRGVVRGAVGDEGERPQRGADGLRGVEEVADVVGAAEVDVRRVEVDQDQQQLVRVGVAPLGLPRLEGAWRDVGNVLDEVAFRFRQRQELGAVEGDRDRRVEIAPDQLLERGRLERAHDAVADAVAAVVGGRVHSMGFA